MYDVTWRSGRRGKERRGPSKNGGNQEEWVAMHERDVEVWVERKGKSGRVREKNVTVEGMLWRCRRGREGKEKWRKKGEERESR